MSNNLESVLEDIESKRSKDYLGISNHPHLIAALEDPDENVLWTDAVLELNWKGKPQKRTIALSTKAIYLFNVGNYKNVLTRIAIEEVTCLIFSEDSDDMIIKCENGKKNSSNLFFF
jgi:hypothetical protein